MSHQTRLKAALTNQPLTDDYPEATTDLINLLTTYHDIIALPGDPLGATSVLQHLIPLLPEASPVYIPSYRHSKSHRAIIDNLVQDMLSNYVIKPTTSP